MNTTTSSESFSVVNLTDSRPLPAVSAGNGQSVPDGVTSLIRYFVFQLRLYTTLDVVVVSLSNIRPVDTAHSHSPGVLMRQCSNHNAVDVVVKTLDLRCFVCQMTALNSKDQEIVNSKLLASICEALGGNREFYVSETEMKEFQTKGTLSPRQAVNNREGEKTQKGILPLRGLLDEVTVLEDSQVIPAGSTSVESDGSDKIPANLDEAAGLRYRFSELLKSLRERSLDGKSELSFNEIMQTTREIFGLPEPRDRSESSRFMRCLLGPGLRFVKRIGEESPAKYKVIGLSFDREKNVTRLRLPPRPSQKSNSAITEGGEVISGFAGQIVKLEFMANEFSRANDEIVTVREALQKVDRELEEHEKDKTRMDQIEAEIKKLRCESDSLRSKKNIRGVKPHREALLRHQAELEATLNSPAHKAAEAKLAELEAVYDHH